MKKTICIILACFFLVMTPIKGYASSAPLVFGIGEEVILPFLLSLLGVQAVNQIDSYDDLVSYNNDVYDRLIESLSGLAGMETIQAWILKACQGLIETDSVIWQKLKELAIDNYIVSSAGGAINATVPSSFGVSDFTYYSDQSLTSTASNNSYFVFDYTNCCRIGSDYIFSTSNGEPFYRYSYRSDGTLSTYYPASQFGLSYYTFNDLTVTYSIMGLGGRTNSPSLDSYAGSTPNNYKAIIAWLMAYGGFVAPSENVAIYSSAFDNVLTAQQKEDIVDGTSVIQLYNPADEQNGLHFVPDPEEPDDIKIPFAVTADWWNYLKQFGNDAKEQVVQAYNALNGLSGNSVGSISDAYDSLGIASVLSSAQSAAEGIASLTDSNVYPNSLTVADTINNSIPSSLTPQTPDDGIDNESEQGLYKLPDLRDYFPFCIPFDLIDLLSCFVAEPETPSFVIALSTGEETVSGNMDLHIWDNIAGVIRTFELIGFTVGLILITRNIIRG